VASDRFRWSILALALIVGGCNRGPSQAELDSIANVELEARRDSLRKVRATRDSIALATYTNCVDSLRRTLMRTPAGRRTLNVRVPAGQARPENTAACGAMPANFGTPTAAPATPGAGSPQAPAAGTTPTPAPAAAAPAGQTPQQQRVARADSVRQARERARADSLARVGERRRTDSIAQVAADSARADSIARARETEVLRETFSYAGASRDPFTSVLSAGDAGPDVGDMILVAVVQDVRSARNSVAVLREKQGTRRWRVKIGDRVGTATVSMISQRDVTFTIQDFGFERQETLSLRRTTEATP
jgi:hypothetical protein